MQRFPAPAAPGAERLAGRRRMGGDMEMVEDALDAGRVSSPSQVSPQGERILTSRKSIAFAQGIDTARRM